MAEAVVRLLAGSVQVDPGSAREGSHSIRNMLDEAADAIGSLALLNSCP
jgi:hypothetical protein